jgi:hypothetical protein
LYRRYAWCLYKDQRRAFCCGPNTAIIVTGPCTENVFVSGKTNLFLGSWWGQNTDLSGSASISISEGIYLYGLNIFGSSADGISVSSSRSVVLDSCTSNSNAGVGLSATNGSEIAVLAPSAFNNNAHGGVNLSGNSFLQMTAWNGLPNELNGNAGPGLYATQASFATFGHTSFSDNTAGRDRIQALAWTFVAVPKHNSEPSSVEIPFKQTNLAGSRYRKRLKFLSGKSARKVLFRVTARLESPQDLAAKSLCSMVSKSLAIPARAWICLR